MSKKRSCSFYFLFDDCQEHRFESLCWFYFAFCRKRRRSSESLYSVLTGLWKCRRREIYWEINHQTRDTRTQSSRVFCLRNADAYFHITAHVKSVTRHASKVS